MTSPRRRIVGVCTKMYFSAARTKAYVAEVLSLLSQSPDIFSNTDVFIIPDHITLASVISQVADSKTPVLVGTQDCFTEDSGAYTGEVSPAVLAEVGTRIVEMGHAERRRLFAEDDAVTAAKAQAVVRNGMIPLVCVGEKTSGEVRAAADEVIGQVKAVLQDLPAEAEVILAYEPVWAIGAAEPAGPGHICGVAELIRECAIVKERAGSTRILYGGSAGPGLFEKLKDAVDGMFLGRFAHSPEAFLQTVKEVAQA